MYCTVLYCTVLYCTVLYCTVLVTVLCYTVLYYTVLYCNVHCHIATLPHCVQPLCPDIVSRHCVQTLCPDIVSGHCVQTLSRHCVCKLNVCSLQVQGGGIQRARRALQVAKGHQPSAGARSRRPFGAIPSSLVYCLRNNSAMWSTELSLDLCLFRQICVLCTTGFVFCTFANFFTDIIEWTENVNRFVS